MKEKAIVSFIQESRGLNFDIEIPLDISADELIFALNQGFGLGIDMSDVMQCHLVCENPTVLLIGDKLLRDFGIRDGSQIYFAK